MENLSGKQVGPYQVMTPLGKGGMGMVYQAYQTGVDRVIALKILPQRFSKSDEFVQRFKREGRIIARLQHPYILPVFDYGEADNYIYIAMPFIKGHTLANVLTASFPIPLPQIENYINQVGDALDYAHTQGIIHRDVKPSNILIDEQDNCLLMDFGIARRIEGDDKLTKTGNVIGTPAYMSPEQGQGLSLDGRSDIYALGVILYEMITGQPPFEAETPAALIVKHIYSPLPKPRTLNPQLSQMVESVTLKALDKNPNNRYPTAGAMAKALQTAMQTATQPSYKIDFESTQLSNTPPLHPPLTNKTHSSFWNFIIGGILLLSIGIGGLWLWNQQQNRRLTSSLPTITPLPPPKPTVSMNFGNGCVGTDFGVSCLMADGGWQNFTKQNASLDNNVRFSTTCSDSSLLFLTGISNINRFDGESWQASINETKDPNWSIAEAIACTEKRDVWVGHHDGVSFFDREWQTYPLKEIMMNEPESVYIVKNIAINPNGLVWITSNKGIAMFDGTAWIDQTPSKKIVEYPHFDHIAIASTGDVWVAKHQELIHFDGLIWQKMLFPEWGVYPQDIVVDHLNQVWVVASNKGIFKFSERQWVHYHADNSQLVTNQINSIVVDTKNRVWVGTSAGLQIWDDNEWYHYTMHNSDIVDNDIRTIAVAGAGPSTLPFTNTKSFGGLTGRVLFEQQPVEAILEICIQRDRPTTNLVSYCGLEQPMIYHTKSTTDGYFTFTDIPRGRYFVAIQTEQTGWVYIDNRVGTAKILIAEGNERNLGDIELTNLIK